MITFWKTVTCVWAGIAGWAFLTGGDQERAMQGLQLAALLAIYTKLHE